MKIEFNHKAYFHFPSHIAFGTDITVWLQLIWRHRREIDRQFFPKIIYITLMALFTTPAAIYERILYDKKIWKTTLQSPIFILGYSRSGTTYLHSILSKDKRLAYCPNYASMMPFIFLTSGKFLRKVIEKIIPETRPMDKEKGRPNIPKEEEFALGAMGEESMITGYYFPERIYEYFKKYVLFRDVERSTVVNWKSNLVYFMQKLTYKHNGKPLLLKSTFNTARIELLLEMFPNAKFIHIYRNPYKVYHSTVRLYEKTLRSLAMQHVDQKKVEDFIFQSYRDTYEQYFESKKLIPKGNLVEFSYENFNGNEIEELKRVYLELSIPDFYTARSAFEQEVKTRVYQPGNYEMDETLKDKIYSNWKFAFDVFGYPK